MILELIASLITGLLALGLMCVVPMLILGFIFTVLGAVVSILFQGIGG